MLIDDALRLLMRNGFHCMQIQTNMADTGFRVGSTIRSVDEAETRLMVIVPDTQAMAMIVGKGSLRIMLNKLANRVKQGTICNVPVIPVTDKRQAWRILEVDKLYLFMDEGVSKKDYAILSQRMEGVQDASGKDESSEVPSETEQMESDKELSQSA